MVHIGESPFLTQRRRSIIDVTTYSAYEKAIADARIHGIPASEMLDRRRLLLTDVRRREVERRFALYILDRLEQADAAGIMQRRWGRPSGSPRDMFVAIQEWLDDLMGEKIKQ